MGVLKDNLGVIVTGITLLVFGAGFVAFMNANYATSADLLNLRSEVQVVRLQTEDALDARIAFLNKEIGRIEAKRTQGELSPTDIQYLADLNREAERLRLLRYGKEGANH